MFILVDDENRENEGDLVYLVQNVIQKLLISWLNMAEVNMFGINEKTNRKLKTSINVTNK